MELLFDIKGWLGWDAAQTPTPSLERVPAMLRRRLSPLGRAAFSVALPLVEEFGPLPVVFVSRHGEIGKTVQLLEDIAHNEPLSPAAFSLSVHNAIAGLLSIHTGSEAAATAIAAGAYDLVPALLEALGQCHDSQSPVLVLSCDTDLPEQYHSLMPHRNSAYALALVVGPGHTWRLAQQEDLCKDFDDKIPELPQSLEFLRLLSQGSNGIHLQSKQGNWRLDQEL